jgi:hypothetical protein
MEGVRDDLAARGRDRRHQSAVQLRAEQKAGRGLGAVALGQAPHRGGVLDAEPANRHFGRMAVTAWVRAEGGHVLFLWDVGDGVSIGKRLGRVTRDVHRLPGGAHKRNRNHF